MTSLLQLRSPKHIHKQSTSSRYFLLSMVVAKGDTIQVLVAESWLPSNIIKVEWSQSLQSKTEDYVVTKYKIQAKGTGSLAINDNC